MILSIPPLARCLFNRPLALDRNGVDAAVEIVAAATAAAAQLDRNASRFDRYYDLVGGIAVIKIAGVLVQNLGLPFCFFGLTGYDGIRLNFLTALADPEVSAIVLDISSGGGDVAGCFDLADLIYQSRGIKPIWAILAENAYSAAYALASAADHITVPRTGGTGSVGVIALHCDFSRALDAHGFTVTIIQYGARKADGNEVQPLAKEALERFQSDVTTMGELFVATVARNRGIAADKVRGTEALTFLGAAGVAIGFADAVMAPDAAFRALLDTLS